MLRGKSESPLRWKWDNGQRVCIDCGKEVYAFKEGLICSGCKRADD